MQNNQLKDITFIDDVVTIKSAVKETDASQFEKLASSLLK